MQKQFTATRLIVLGALFAATLAWMLWMVQNRPPVNPTTDAPPAPFDWSGYTGIALASIVFVVIVDVIFIAWTMRRAKSLTPEEKQPFGPVDAASQARAGSIAKNPVERAVARSVSKGGRS